MTSEPVQKTEPKLPRRDWVLLPLIALLTVVVLVASVECSVRKFFDEPSQSITTCLTPNEARTSFLGISGCRAQERDRESGSIEYRFDSHGYRNDQDLKPKQPGVFRIVMTGSSFALAYRVNNADSLASLVPFELSQKTGREVELYNEGMWDGFSHVTALRFNDVLSAHPDMVLWMITQHDVMEAGKKLSVSANAPDLRKLGAKVRDKIERNSGAMSFLDLVSAFASEIAGKSKTAYAVQFVLYRSQTEFLKGYLAGFDQENGFLKSQQSQFWQKQLAQVATDAADMEFRSRQAGIPFVAVYVPNRAQAIMVNAGEWPKGYNPYKLDEQLRTIITSHGGIFLDILPGVHGAPDTGEDFLPVDGHPNALGDALFARLIAQQLTSGAIPDLAAGKQGIDASAMRKK